VTDGADRRAFLERSLVDLEEEHDAGDLADDDYRRLKGDYERRLAALDRARPTATRPATPPRPLGRRLAVWAGVGAFAVLAGVLLAQAAGRRSTDGAITGIDVGAGDATTTTAGPPPSVPDVDPELQRCFTLAGGEAFDCYIAFTRANPADADGFLYFGLFSVQQGLAADQQELLEGGETFLRRALELDPTKVAARVNLAVLLERTGRDDEAQAELDLLAGQDLPEDLQGLVDFVEQNLAAAEGEG
jgi:hypothetical protein